VLAEEFRVNATAINATVSVFMLTFAIAPLIWSSYADWKGRRPLYIISIAIYTIANILLAAVPTNFGALVFLRIVQAFGSAAVVSMGVGTVADVCHPITKLVRCLNPRNEPSAWPYFSWVPNAVLS
jgi:MFS family permease